MAAADVRVRLSAEGVAEVVGALRTVQREAVTAGARSGVSFKPLQTALQAGLTFARRLATSITAGAIGLGFYATRALDAADNASKLGQQLGDATGNMTALAAVAESSDVGLDKFQRGVGQMVERLADLRRGEPGATVAFRRLGLSAKDFDGKSTAESFLVVARATSSMATSVEKTNAVTGVFGERIGRDLIPMLNEVGGKSLPEIREQAERLGLLIDGKTAVSLRALADVARSLQLAIRGAVTQFLAGFAPGAVATVQSLTQGTHYSAVAFRDLGRAIGEATREAIPLMNNVDWLVTHLRAMRIEAFGFSNAMLSLQKGDFAGAALMERVSRDTVTNLKQELALRMKQRDELYRNWKPATFSDEADPSGADKAPEDRPAARIKALEAIQQVEDRLAEARGQHHEVVMRQIEDQLAKYREALLVQGTAVDEADRMVAAARETLTLSERARVLEADYSSRRLTFETLIGQAQEARRRNLISKAEYLERVAAIEAARLPVLREIATAMQETAIALGDPELIAKANQLALQARTLGTEAAVGASELGDALKGGIQSALTQSTESFRDFMAFMLNGVRIIASAIQQVLVTQLVTSWFGGVTSTAPVAKAGGGIIRGPGTGLSDSIPAWLSNGEYIMTARATAAAGNLRVLEAMRAGARFDLSGRRLVPISPTGLRYAGGGLVAPERAPSTAELAGTLRVEVPPGVDASWVDTRAGRRSLLRFIVEHRRTINRELDHS